MRKKILVVSRHAPYGTSIARDAIDAVLASAAYDQDLSLLFMDDGVFQLISNQNPADIEQKNIGSMLKALPLYGVDNIFVHRESLIARGIAEDELLIPNLKILGGGSAVHKLIVRQDQLLSF